MTDPLLKTCFHHLLKMGWILIARWAIYVKNEDLTLCFSPFLKKVDYFHGDVFFLLTRPLMGDRFLKIFQENSSHSKLLFYLPEHAFQAFNV
jgi:hypothetical protein